MAAQFSRGPGRHTKRSAVRRAKSVTPPSTSAPQQPHGHLGLRLSWLLTPLLTVALMSAHEWPARAAMWADGEGWTQNVVVNAAENWSRAVSWMQGVSPASPSQPDMVETKEHVVIAAARPEPSASVERPSIVRSSPPKPQSLPLHPAAVAIATPEIIKPSAPMLPSFPAADVNLVAETAPPPPDAPSVNASQEDLTVAVAKEPVTAAKILLIGDSLMGGVAPGMRQGLPQSFVLNNQYKVSTGLTNEQYFNWPSAAAELVKTDQPDWVVIHLGANDPHSIRDNGHWIKFGTPKWNEAYASRVKDLINAIRSSHPTTRIVWLGMPAMRSSELNDNLAIITTIQRAVAASENVPFIDGHEALGAIYQKEGAMPDGRRRVWRANDGIHYSPAAGRMLSRVLAHNPHINWKWSDG